MLPVFDIKRYSINDGPGIRITVFLKGCPLHCIWCHNPEGISPNQTKLYTVKKCIACRSCIEACPQGALKAVRGRGIVTDPKKCILCGKCVEACPAKAMEFAAKYCSDDALMREIEKEIPFFAASPEVGVERGGVTFCGGEPLLQKENLFPVMERCRAEGIHIAVDTTLYAEPQLVREYARRCDLFLVDLKMMDSEAHKRFCGVPNELILSNIRMIAATGHDFIIRIPLIVGVNATRQNLEASAHFLAGLGIERKKSDGSACRGPLVELLPYHDIGKNKHVRMGTLYNPEGVPMSPPTAEHTAEAVAVFAAEGVEARQG